MNYNRSYNPTRGFKLVKQINNLKIYLDESVAVTQFKVVAPGKRILEEFCFQKDAETFCADTKDFTRNKKKNLPN